MGSGLGSHEIKLVCHWNKEWHGGCMYPCQWCKNMIHVLECGSIKRYNYIVANNYLKLFRYYSCVCMCVCTCFRSLMLSCKAMGLSEFSLLFKLLLYVIEVKLFCIWACYVVFEDSFICKMMIAMSWLNFYYSGWKSFW